MALSANLEYEFRFGSKAQYDALATKQEGTLYFLTDTRQIYVGTTLYTGSIEIVSTFPNNGQVQGVLYVNPIGEAKIWNGMQWIQIARFVEGAIPYVATGSTPSSYDEAKNDHIPTVKAVRDFISQHANDYANSYKIVRKGTANTNASAIYSLQLVNSQGQAVDAPNSLDIAIPKDMVVQSGTVVTVTSAQAGTRGFPATAGTYIKLVIANATNDTLWIDVAGLIEYVTSGSTTNDKIQIAVDANTHKVTASLKANSIVQGDIDTTTWGKIENKNWVLNGQNSTAVAIQTLQTVQVRADDDVDISSDSGTISIYGDMTVNIYSGDKEVNFNGCQLANVLAPTAGTDASNKKYVDDAVSGAHKWKAIGS